MKQRKVSLDLRYRTRDIHVEGDWYDDDGSMFINSARIEGEDGGGDFWPVIEDTAVGEELTKVCEARLARQFAARDREMRETHGMGYDAREAAQCARRTACCAGCKMSAPSTRWTPGAS